MAIDGFGFDEMNNPEIPGADVFGVLFGIVVFLMVIGVATMIIVAVYRAKRMSDRGQNPLTMQEDIAYQAMQSQTLAPTKTLEQRLAELDDLHRRGVISDDEHRTARAEALRA
ncbi:SHOCT domain-containing protein [Curtobacterium caseinilyticum]|uniref:SHOCT domain-containing protein n=1 Tax=Curtobacterium caseinilyticum TaxID=3055137 RepID=A0ABT7TU53_9MICO|nr:SHOCT domain-containing protein [Curtobacterium caseinilyticum]MDM7893120.1 SHOCT domain-containing protein [Curtobacterium caseinilyticum]